MQAHVLQGREKTETLPFYTTFAATISIDFRVYKAHLNAP